jgi:hypothetical protein
MIGPLTVKNIKALEGATITEVHPVIDGEYWDSTDTVGMVIQLSNGWEINLHVAARSEGGHQEWYVSPTKQTKTGALYWE